MSKITSAMAVLGVVAGLGVAALPLSSYALNGPVESSSVTVRTIVNNSIAVSTEGVDLVDLGTVTGTTTGHSTIDVTVSGSVDKYSLGVMDADNDTNMTLQGSAGSASDVIPTIDTSASGYAPAKTLSGAWGFRIAKGAHEATEKDWEAMPAYDAAGTTNLLTGVALDKTNGSVTTVEFGVNVNGLTLTNGTYEDKVIFTAIEAA